MRRTRIYRINVLFAVHERPHLKRVLNGISAYARQGRDWQLRLPYYYSTTPMLNHAGDAKLPINGQISGVPTRAHLKSIAEKKVPTVLLNCAPPVPNWAGNVEPNFVLAAQSAVQHFRKQGFQNLAYFSSPHPERAEHHRYGAALRAASREADLHLELFDQLPPGGNWGDVDGQQEQWSDWVRQLPMKTGVICGDDESAARVYLAAEKAGRVIGENLYVLGCGNEAIFCDAMNPPLSSIQLNYFGMGWEAAAMLDGILKTGQVPTDSLKIQFASVIERLSSRPQAHQDSRVERALAVIWKDLGDGLKVEKVAKRVNMDRRHLHRLFMQQLGRSPMQEIQLARVETAKRLLCESTESLSSIALACGFSDQAHFARSIKKATGKTPSEFRLIGHRG